MTVEFKTKPKIIFFRDLQSGNVFIDENEDVWIKLKLTNLQDKSGYACRVTDGKYSNWDPWHKVTLVEAKMVIG